MERMSDVYFWAVEVAASELDWALVACDLSGSELAQVEGVVSVKQVAKNVFRIQLDPRYEVDEIELAIIEAAENGVEERASSYHDVLVIVDGERYEIGRQYFVELSCNKTSGWRLWLTINSRTGTLLPEPELIGGEFDSQQFEVWVKGYPVLVAERSSDDE